MPLYEYRCFDCGAKFEKLASHSAADSVACTTCGGDRAKRLLSVFASIGRGTAAATTVGSGGWSSGGGCGCTSCSCGHAH